MSQDTPGVRYAEVERETSNTRVRVVIDMDGGKKTSADTGIGYFDYLLALVAQNGNFDLGVSAEADLDLADRHVVYDVGLCMGQAMRQAMGGNTAGFRVSSVAVPVRDALVLVSLDLSSGPHLSYELGLSAERIGGLTTANLAGFFANWANSCQATLHVKQLSGSDSQNLVEATFMGFGRAIQLCAGKPE